MLMVFQFCFFFKEEVFLSGVCRDHTSFIFSCAKIINYVWVFFLLIFSPLLIFLLVLVETLLFQIFHSSKKAE